jgi:predicted ATPase/class 3 adenylate cyclase
MVTARGMGLALWPLQSWRAIVPCMAEQPTGTVTMLFTDIEGSTRLLERLGRERYAEALDLHRRLLRAAFEGHGGYEVDYEGDAFFVAFSRAGDALAAAAEAQEALSLAEWPERDELRVRMGLHTGEPLAVPPKYLGLDVHRAARIMAAGHGGQVLISEATRRLLADDVAGGLGLRDLGAHRLKDLSAPERIYQLGQVEFPRLRTLHQTNLPIPGTPFLGREEELAEVVSLLSRDDVRLLTLTGPGGTGKTRLAVQAAGEASDRFPDGITWVSLAPLRDPSLLLPAVAHALEIREEPGTKLAETLAAALDGKQALLLLDNVEHLLPDAAPDVAALGSTVEPTTLLVTSRERLHVQGEQIYPVPTLAESDGAELFLVRARALEPSFDADGAVAELCSRLDNLPLALELAAARTTLFSPEQLLGRLGQRLDLLKGGAEVDPRQQTLRATIDWSYDLLSEGEKQLFRRLSVFAGGCTYEAAEGICGAVPDTLQSLLDKSLLRRRDTERGRRYRMLETIREFAAEQLQQSAEDLAQRRSHAEWYLDLMELARSELDGPDQARWLAMLDDELDNLRASLRESLNLDIVMAARLGSALMAFWHTRGHLTEGREAAALLIARRAELPPGLEADVFRWAGLLAREQGDLVGASDLYRELERAARKVGDDGLLADALDGLGAVHTYTGDFGQALELIEEALQVARRTGDPERTARFLNDLGYILVELGRLNRARDLLDECLELSRAAGHHRRIAFALNTRAYASLKSGDFSEGRDFLQAALRIFMELADRQGVADTLEGIGSAEAGLGRATKAARLWGAGAVLRDEIGAEMQPSERNLRHVLELDVCTQLGTNTFRTTWDEGAALGEGKATEYALTPD